MRRATRLQALLALSITVAAMMLLSAGISGLDLRPGQPFSLARHELANVGRSGAGSETLMTFIRVALVTAGLLLPVALVYLIVSPKARKRLLRDLVTLLLFFAVYYLLFSARSDAPVEEGRTAITLPQTQALPAAPAAEFVAAPPQWLVSVASISLALLLAALSVGTVVLILRRRRPSKSPLAQLARDAQGAMDALQAGADLRNTVIRCYRDMSLTLNQQRGIRRHPAMTPREFEHHLRDVGLPGGYVTQITRLFEDVRYGTKVPGQPEERQALLCLRAIVEASTELPGA